MCSPDLFLLGAPKCGTSSLFRWLGDHPRIQPSNPKETFYLVDRESPFYRPGESYLELGETGWRAFFEASESERLYRLEGTTHTLFQGSAPEVLARREKVPHALVLLRKPSERIYSSFQFTRHSLAGIDPELGFARFWSLLRRGDTAALTRHARVERSLWVLMRDLDFSRYATWLEGWRRRFPPERLHIVLFEDLIADPRATLLSLSRCLGLEPDGSPSFYTTYGFPRLNQTFETRSPRLHGWVRRFRPCVPRHRLSLGLYRFYLALQRRPAVSERSTDDREALAEIDRLLAEDNRRLGEQFGLDLGAWE